MGRRRAGWNRALTYGKIGGVWENKKIVAMAEKNKDCPEFSGLVGEQAAQARNVANQEAMMSWLGSLAESKLGRMRDSGSGDEKEREESCEVQTLRMR